MPSNNETCDRSIVDFNIARLFGLKCVLRNNEVYVQTGDKDHIRRILFSPTRFWSQAGPIMIRYDIWISITPETESCSVGIEKLYRECDRSSLLETIMRIILEYEKQIKN